MSIFDFFKSTKPQKTAANVAKNRLLQILIAHDGDESDSSRRRLINTLKKEIMAVLAKHVQLPKEGVTVNLDKSGDTSFLGIEVKLPENEKNH